MKPTSSGCGRETFARRSIFAFISLRNMVTTDCRSSCASSNSRFSDEDVRQETFTRFYVALREGKIVHPDRLGSFVNSICNHVLMEHYRTAVRHGSVDDDDQKKEFPSPILDPLAMYSAQEIQQKVREILEQLPERDRRLLREIFLEERDKDDVCRDFGVDREYLRVLLHRAKNSFKQLYLRNNDTPGFRTA